MRSFADEIGQEIRWAENVPVVQDRELGQHTTELKAGQLRKMMRGGATALLTALNA
jgi:hypothetical protein